ncbi:hypothetical protein [uncultured Sunxiuqinia sp.]|uniref:hypothetical protein n=1 Tax=uncultured Sunxiuqinia sp. TaxID=1573825 RepID=UPI0030D759AD|tara:strand:- start:18639 stop:18842 length:204 start_codon:yes stop_codon:yes gene_type:complete
MRFISESATKVLADQYFKELFLKVEKNEAFNFFHLDKESLNKKEFIDLLRFADILSIQKLKTKHTKL